MMLRQMLFAILAGFTASAYAGLGPQISETFVPEGLCLITISADSGQRVEICSGFLLDSRHLMTAGHCTKHLTKASTIQCGNIETRMHSFSLPESLDLENLEFEDSLRAYDTAIVELIDNIPLENPVSVAATEFQLQQVIAESKLCGFFGFSHELGNSIEPVNSKSGAIAIDPRFLSIVSGYIELDGRRGASALVQPGDSGGALACLGEQGWIMAGVVSGRNWDFESYFAPLYQHPAFSQKRQMQNSLIDRTDGQRESISVGGRYPSSHLKNSLAEVEPLSVTPINAVKPQSIQVAEEYFVSQYAIFEKTPHTEYLGFSDVDRLKAWNEPHSTIDHVIVRFEPLKKIGDHWLGDITFTSSTLSYSCIHGFVCSSGTMTQVLVAEKDLFRYNSSK